MTIAQFYGLDQRDYAGATYPTGYFRCFADGNSSEAATSRDTWLQHYWPDVGQPLDTNQLIARLTRISRFGYAGMPHLVRSKVQAIRAAQSSLNSRLGDINHAVNGILLHDDTSPALAIRVLHGLELPGFRQLSFGSKLLMFLNPAKFVVLDRKVANALHEGTVNGNQFSGEFIGCCERLRERTPAPPNGKFDTIPPRGPWPEIYGAWCAACASEAQRWNDRPDPSGDSWIASDIERVAFSTPSARPVSLKRK